MRRPLVFLGGLLLGCFAYLVLAEVSQHPTSDFSLILFSTIPVFGYMTPFRSFDLAFLATIVLGASLLARPKATAERGKKKKVKIETKSGTKPPYDVEAIIIGKGINQHEHVQTTELKTMYKHNDAEYQIDPRKLYIANRNIFRRFGDNIHGIKRRFCIVFKEGQPVALGPEEAQIEKVSSGLLHVVERSTIFRRAFAELFAKQIGGKKILFIIILIVVGVVVYLMWSGQVDLRRLGFF